jgi:hypothetical protein
MFSWQSRISFLLPYLPYILLLVLAFLYWLSRRETPIDGEESKNPKCDSDDTAETGPDLVGYPIRVIVESTPPPPPLSEKQKAAEKRRERRETNKNFLEQVAAVIACGLLLANFGLWIEQNESTTWIRRQSRIMLETERPRITANRLRNITVEVGKPLSAVVEIKNFGHQPGSAWSQIYIESGQGVIDRLQSHPLDRTTENGTFEKKLLAPDESTNEFPVIPAKGSEKILTQGDFDKISNGNLDVVVYGQIEYRDLGDPEGLNGRDWNSIFCFHRLADGKMSACPNKKGAYTYWAR